MTQTIKLKTVFFTLLGVMGIETLAFVLLIFGGKPEPSISIGLIVIVPFLCGLNIILGLLLLIRKLKNIAVVGFVNAVVSPLIFYFIWTSWYSKIDDRNYLIYSFNLGQSQYEINLSKNGNDFSITDVTNQHDGTTSELYYGKFQVKADTIILGNEHNMFIVNEKLFNFPKDSSSSDLQLRAGNVPCNR
jgi:hypothetical protein